MNSFSLNFEIPKYSEIKRIYRIQKRKGLNVYNKGEPKFNQDFYPKL